jgi:hypothetical protein
MREDRKHPPRLSGDAVHDVPKIHDPVPPRVPEYHCGEDGEHLLFRFRIPRAPSELLNVGFRGRSRGILRLSHGPTITTDRDNGN